MNENFIRFRSARWAAGLCLVLVFAAVAEDAPKGPAPSYHPVDAARLNGGTLLLPEVSGSIDAPGDGFKWFVWGDGNSYMTVDDISGERFLVKAVLNVMSSAGDYPKCVAEMKAGSRSGIEKGGAVIVHESDERLDCPPHGTLAGFSQTFASKDKQITVLTFAFNAGRNILILKSYPMDGKPSANFVKMVGSLKFKGPPPPAAAKVAAPLPPKNYSASELALMAVTFFFLGILMGGGAIVRSRIFRSPVTRLQIILSICAICFVQCQFFYRGQYQLGLAGIPMPLGFAAFFVIRHYMTRPKLPHITSRDSALSTQDFR